MNKKEFTKELKTRLAVLDDNEIKDIIDEYTNIIDEKVKNGQDEKEAIADFGEIDEFTKEILKAYKINPKFNESKSNAKDIVDNVESWIKKWARKLSDATKNLISDIKKEDNEVSIDLIFEIIIKVILLLILLSVLRIPFYLIESLGTSILNLPVYPLDVILLFIWKLFVWVCYIVASVFIGIALFKSNFKISDTKEKPIKKNKEKKTPTKQAEVKVTTETMPEENLDSEVIVKEVKPGSLSKVVKAILKALIIICILIPLWLIIMGLVAALVIIIYYLIMGIDLWGVILILIGLIGIFGYLSIIINNIFKTHKRAYFFPFPIFMILILVGGLVVFNTVKNYTYYDNMSDTIHFNLTNKEFNYNIDDSYELDICGINNKEHIIDNTMEDGQVKVIATYYDKMVYIYSNEHRGYQNIKNRNYITVCDYVSVEYSSFWTIYDDVIFNLEKKEIYDYSSLYNVHYKIYANENTMSSI